MIHIKEISKSFSDTVVLKAVSLSVHKQDFLVIHGASGSGKTTLLRIIAGLEPATSGEILIGSTTATHNKSILLPPHKRQLGMVFQDLALWPHLSVKQNIAFGLSHGGKIKENQSEYVEEIAEQFDIMPVLNRHPGSLSGGEQQRVALARSLISKPSVLLLDEPLANLDRKRREQLLQYLSDYRIRHNIAILFITHFPESVSPLCTKTYFIEEGEIHEDYNQ